MKSNAVSQQKYLAKGQGAMATKARRPCCINILACEGKLASGLFAGIIKLKGIILKTMKEWNQFMKNMANLARNSHGETEEYVHYKYRLLL